MAKGKWQNYAQQHSEALGQLFNRSIRQTLRVGLTTLVANTKMDSGRAAAHWLLRPNNGPGGVRPGGWAQQRFPNPDYGESPVGYQGDKKGSDPAVVTHVLERETRRSISATVRGRRPATRFTFLSPVPQTFNDLSPDGKHTGTGKVQDYHKNAELAEAIEAAQGEMQRRFTRLIARGNVRKRPLG